MTRNGENICCTNMNLYICGKVCGVHFSFWKEGKKRKRNSLVSLDGLDGKFAALSGSGQLHGKWNGNSGSGTFRK